MPRLNLSLSDPLCPSLSNVELLHRRFSIDVSDCNCAVVTNGHNIRFIALLHLTNYRISINKLCRMAQWKRHYFCRSAAIIHAYSQTALTKQIWRTKEKIQGERKREISWSSLRWDTFCRRQQQGQIFCIAFASAIDSRIRARYADRFVLLCRCIVVLWHAFEQCRAIHLGYWSSAVWIAECSQYMLTPMALAKACEWLIRTVH